MAVACAPNYMSWVPELARIGLRAYKYQYLVVPAAVPVAVGGSGGICAYRYVHAPVREGDMGTGACMCVELE